MKKFIALALLVGGVAVNSDAAVDAERTNKVKKVEGLVVAAMAVNPDESVATVRAKAKAHNAHRKTTLKSATDMLSLTV